MVSQKLKGQPATAGSFKPGYDARRVSFTNEQRIRGIQTVRENRKAFYAVAEWDALPHAEQRRRVLAEQNDTCLRCEINEWMGEQLVLELDHINGDHNDNQRDNLRYLCLNCHSLTPTYRNRKRKAT